MFLALLASLRVDMLYWKLRTAGDIQKITEIIEFLVKEVSKSLVSLESR